MRFFLLQLPVSSCHDSPQAIFTSFKLPKSSPPPPTPPGILGHSSMLHHPALTPLGHLANLGREVSSPPPGPHGLSASLSGAPTSVINTLPCAPLMAAPVAESINRGNPIMLPIAGPILANPPQLKVCIYLYKLRFWNVICMARIINIHISQYISF